MLEDEVEMSAKQEKKTRRRKKKKVGAAVEVEKTSSLDFPFGTNSREGRKKKGRERDKFKA